MPTPHPRRLPPHELNARRARKRVLTHLPALAPPSPPAACPEKPAAPPRHKNAT